MNSLIVVATGATLTACPYDLGPEYWLADELVRSDPCGSDAAAWCALVPMTTDSAPAPHVGMTKRGLPRVGVTVGGGDLPLYPAVVGYDGSGAVAWEWQHDAGDGDVVLRDLWVDSTGYSHLVASGAGTPNGRMMIARISPDGRETQLFDMAIDEQATWFDRFGNLYVFDRKEEGAARELAISRWTRDGVMKDRYGAFAYDQAEDTRVAGLAGRIDATVMFSAIVDGEPVALGDGDDHAHTWETAIDAEGRALVSFEMLDLSASSSGWYDERASPCLVVEGALSHGVVMPAVLS